MWKTRSSPWPRNACATVHWPKLWPPTVMPLICPWELYTRGLGDFLSVLESQRSLFGSEDQLVQSERAVVANLTACIKRLAAAGRAGSPSSRLHLAPSLRRAHSERSLTIPVTAPTAGCGWSPSMRCEGAEGKSSRRGLTGPWDGVARKLRRRGGGTCCCAR
jgi:hypothetical protein